MSNNLGNDEGANSPKLFLSLSSYNRFRLCRSRRSESLQSSSSSTTPDSVLFPFHEIFSALKNSGGIIPSSSLRSFFSSSSGHCAMWEVFVLSFKRCTLRNEKVIICCRRDHRDDKHLSPPHLSSLTSNSRHPNLVSLLGASQCKDRCHVYLVYEDIPGATLRDCLESSNSRLSNWIWRMQVALDLARGLEYIHQHCRMVHNLITISTVIVTEPNCNACICLFGAGDFRNEVIEGITGLLAPEAIMGSVSQKSDVYAFGAVILELISGKSMFENRNGEYVHLIEAVRDHLPGDHEYSELDEETRRVRVMQLVDPRLHNSFPVETAESLIRVALQCVEDDPSARPEMASVARDIQQMFSDSKVWQKQTMKSPTTAFTLSSLRKGNLLHFPNF